VALRWNSLAIRLILPAALIGMTAIGAAGPAHAEPAAEAPAAPAAEAPAAEAPDPGTTVEVHAPDRVVTTTGGSKSVLFGVVNTSREPLSGLVLSFGTAAAPLDPRIGLQPPTGCTATACAVGDLAPGVRKPYTFTVKPTAELPATGVSVALTVNNAAGELQGSTTVLVVPAGVGIDLETAPIPDIKLAAGGSAVLPISVRNNGSKATQGVAISLVAPKYVTFPNNYSNCVDVEDRGIVCSFDLKLEPGSVFTLKESTPLTVAADKVAPGPADYYSGLHAYGLEEDSDEATLSAARQAVKQRGGTKLELVPAVQGLAVDQSELNDWDNTVPFWVKVALNQADSVAIGADFKGKVGDTKTIKVGIRNAGPAVVLDSTKTWKHTAKVRIPSGLKLTKVDKNCVPNADGEPNWDAPGRISGHDYICLGSAQLKVGAKELFSFTAKIEDGQNEDEGSITVDGGVQDPKSANNVAKIEVKLTSGNGGGGGSGGGLPITGAPVAQVGVAGLLLVLLGAFTLVLTRRRPTVS
jgi:hypothetical protein